MNQVVIVGCLGRDPELQHTAGGTAVTKFSVAVNDRIKSGTEWKDRVDWLECSAFGPTAERICQYMAKGRKIIVMGKLRTDEWNDKETGAKRSRTFVLIDQWQTADAKPQGREAPQASQQASGGGSLDEDTPF